MVLQETQDFFTELEAKIEKSLRETETEFETVWEKKNW